MYILHLPTGFQFTKLKNPLYILSIDPGLSNLGIRIEKRSPGKITTIFFEVLNLKNDEFHELLTYLINMMDDLLPLIKKCQIIIIEQQISKKNPKCTRLFERILTYLLCKLDRSLIDPVIYEVDTHAVKSFFSMPRGKGKKVKDYVGLCSEMILKSGGDIDSYEKITRLSKALRNHLDDTVAQIEVICQLEDFYPILDSQSLKKLISLFKKYDRESDSCPKTH